MTTEDTVPRQERRFVGMLLVVAVGFGLGLWAGWPEKEEPALLDYGTFYDDLYAPTWDAGCGLGIPRRMCEQRLADNDSPNPYQAPPTVIVVQPLPQPVVVIKPVHVQVRDDINAAREEVLRGWNIGKD